jgi:diguanylate cyclase (GGDEF)-like protein
MRRTSFASLLIGVVLLSTGPLVVLSALAQERQHDTTLQNDAAQVASAFGSYFERARSLDLLLAQSSSFRTADGDALDYRRANRALQYLEKLYPDAIGEACLINSWGVELARVTEGVAAPRSELASNERDNPFFAPTMALAPGQVYQAAPYVSSDTKGWVISNSTRVTGPDGSPLIVHFEVSLASFNEYLATASDAEHVAIVDLDTGRAILQNDAGLPSPSGRFPQLLDDSALPSTTAPVTIQTNGQKFALGPIVRHRGNANQWAVLEWSAMQASLFPPWTGVVAAALGLGFVLLFLLRLRRHHGALRMAARLDHLTGMANRKAFEEAMEAAVQAARDGERVALLALDLDGFKQVNDTLGHDKGDIVLQEIGRRLHANTFEYDTAARLGGDEFAVVLRHLHEDADVAQVAHRLRAALVRPIEIDGVSRFIGVSVGAAAYGLHGSSSTELLRSADAAMYRAKRGREGVRVYDAGTEAGTAESWLAAELFLSIENDQISLAYQPKYAVDTGRIVGVEALARWTREGETPIPPSTFVPLAEQTGLIRPLTHLTLRKALDEVNAWRAAGVLIPVSVNLSAQLVTDASLYDELEALLDERGLRGDSLILEITETALIQDFDAACQVLASLRSLGVRIELDDFGSGYASFKALQRISLDGVKVDQALVNDSSNGPQSLLAVTIEMGRLLGLYIVAEGIENEAGLEAVRRLGVDVAQGYHLAHPMPADGLRVLFRDAGMTSTSV